MLFFWPGIHLCGSFTYTIRFPLQILKVQNVSGEGNWWDVADCRVVSYRNTYIHNIREWRFKKTLQNKYCTYRILKVSEQDTASNYFLRSQEFNNLSYCVGRILSYSSCNSCYKSVIIIGFLALTLSSMFYGKR